MSSTLNCGLNKSSLNEIEHSVEDKLRLDLNEAHKEIRFQDLEIARLNRIRRNLEREIEELSVKLFEEAYKMVDEAHRKQLLAEKREEEGRLKIDVLTAEVEALKLMVLTSTPSQPNVHLHPQINQSNKKVTFFNFHRRSPSHCNLLYGRKTDTNILTDEDNIKQNFVYNSNSLNLDFIDSHNEFEFDPVSYKDFLNWIERPRRISLLLSQCDLSSKSPFLRCIYYDDIYPCLQFNNDSLNKKILQAVENGTVFIEPVINQGNTNFLKTCALLQIPRICKYRMKIDDGDSWYNISKICRNRIISVCDLYNFLKYIERGLVKCPNVDIYKQIMQFRLKINQSRLGFDTNSDFNEKQ